MIPTENGKSLATGNISFFTEVSKNAQYEIEKKPKNTKHKASSLNLNATGKYRFMYS